MDAQGSQTETAEAALQYNVTGTRIVAALLDTLVLAILFVVMAFAFGDTGKESSDGGLRSTSNLKTAPS